jgi:hypothetical protein
MEIVTRMNVIESNNEFKLEPDNQAITIDPEIIRKGYKEISLLLGEFEPSDFNVIVCMVNNDTNKVIIALAINVIDGENNSRWAGFEQVVSEGKI